MQQRRVRLGDILDDYCPRERRITNHAVVAMIDETVKQTRCTTCDADHVYKGARLPAPRRRKTGALSSEDLESGARPALFAPDAADPADEAGEADAAFGSPEEPLHALDDESVSDAETAAGADPLVEAEPPADAAGPGAIDASGEREPSGEADEPGDADQDEWPVHRPLIRATLPRPEGQVPERKAPDFTIRQASGGRFDSQRNGQRHRGPRPARQAQGQPSGPSSRFGGRSGSGQGSRHGAGPGARQGSGQGSGQGGPQGQRHGNRPGPAGGGRPGPGRGRKRGR
jgi:hypothetical protein